MFVACEHAAEKLGYTVFLADSHSSLERECDEMERLQNQRVDAILMIGGSIDQRRVSREFIATVCRLAQKTPIVTSSCVVDAENCYAIRINESQCMKLLLEHLIELGHQDIAVIGGRLEVSSTWEKFEQFKKQMKEYNIPIRKELIAIRGSYDFDTGCREMNRMLDAGNLPTAVIAINDAAALGVMQAIRDHGLRIPEDISVVGYDNTLYSTLANPTLTSIDYDYDTYGERLVEIAIAAVEQTATEKMQIVEPKLVVRKSTAAASRINKRKSETG
jgi:DNA-binding LacI/PurR family transcriptional regulator